MARMTLAAQVAQLRERCARLEVENAGLREIAERARRAPRGIAKPDFAVRREAARRFCEEHNVRSCSRADVDAYLASAASR